MRGATRINAEPCKICRHFNPRSPCGERPAGIIFTEEVFSISIHAPRAGSDYSEIADFVDDDIFQSTLPVRGATTSGSVIDERVPRFQSTLPVRGATLGRIDVERRQ